MLYNTGVERVAVIQQKMGAGAYYTTKQRVFVTKWKERTWVFVTKPKEKTAIRYVTKRMNAVTRQRLGKEYDEDAVCHRCYLFNVNVEQVLQEFKQRGLIAMEIYRSVKIFKEISTAGLVETSIKLRQRDWKSPNVIVTRLPNKEMTNLNAHAPTRAREWNYS